MPIGSANWVAEGMLGGLRNVAGHSGAITGFQFTFTNQFFHGSHPLGWMHDLTVTLDGQHFASDRIFFHLHHQRIPVTLFPEISDIWWQPREAAVVEVGHAGGLAPGEHTLRCDFNLGTIIFTPSIDRSGAYRTMPGHIEARLPCAATTPEHAA